jgi:hypothetical protein
MKAIITKTVNTIQVSSKKGQTFEIVKETEKSFQILVDGKVRMISKANAEIFVEAKKKEGVISEMITILKTGFVTKQAILEKLNDIFPERQTASMWNTINCQFSHNPETGLRIEREQKIKVLRKEKKGIVTFKIS